MIKAGRSAEEINAYWRPIREGFTKRGGFTGFVRGIGHSLNALGVLTMISGILAEQKEIKQHKANGEVFVPYPGHEDLYKAGVGRWAPREGLFGPIDYENRQQWQ